MRERHAHPQSAVQREEKAQTERGEKKTHRAKVVVPHVRKRLSHVGAQLGKGRERGDLKASGCAVPNGGEKHFDARGLGPRTRLLVEGMAAQNTLVRPRCRLTRDGHDVNKGRAFGRKKAVPGGKCGGRRGHADRDP